MKKKSIKVAAIAMISSVALSAGLTTACGHAFTDEWTSDATNHWHACVEPDCNEKLGEAAHVDENEDGKCDVCQYVLKTGGNETKHEHAYDGDWQTDGEKHWKECTADGCTNPKAKSEEGAHVYDDDSDATCNTCGYERVIEIPHEHAYDGGWQTDGEKHWKECTADGCTNPKAKSEEGTHDYDNDRDETCNICGYEREVATPLSAEAKAFKAAVNELGEINENSAARIDETIAGLKADYAALSETDKEDETVAAAKTALDARETEITAFKSQAATAVAALKAEVDKINGTAEATEEYYDELDALHEQVKALGTYSKTLWDEADTTKLKGEITRVVHIISLNYYKDEINATVNSAAEITASAESKAYYASLMKIKDDISKLEGDRKEIWNTLFAESEAKLNDEITRVVNTVAETKKADETFGWGGNGSVNIVRVYYNLLGDILELEAAPSVSYSLNGAEEPTVVTLTLNEGAYVGKIPFNPTQQNNIVYTVGTEAEQTLNIAAFKANIWLTIVAADGERTKAFNNENKLIINQTYSDNGAKTYAYIYPADQIDVGPINADSQISISGFALGKVEVSNGMTREEIYTSIARQYGELLDKELEVRFVFISENEEEIGEEDDKQVVWVQTGVNSASVSERIALALTVEDTKDRLHLGNAGTVIGNDGGVTIGAAWNSNTLAEQFNSYENITPATPVTADNVHEHLRYNVEVTLNGEMKSFNVNCVKGGSINKTVMLSNIFELFHTLGANEYTVTLRLDLREDSPYNSVLKESVPRATTTKTFTLTLPGNEAQLRFTANGDFFEYLRTGGGNGSVFNFGVSYVEVKFSKDDETHYAYIFADADDSNLYIYDNAEGSGTSKRGIGTVTNGWITMTDFNIWVQNTYGISGFSGTEWTYNTKAVYDNEYEVNGETVTDGGYSDDIVYVAPEA